MQQSALIGDLDWGPVLAGYVAALLARRCIHRHRLACSSRARTDSQIVSLMLASLAVRYFLPGGQPGDYRPSGRQLVSATMLRPPSAAVHVSNAITRGCTGFAGSPTIYASHRLLVFLSAQRLCPGGASAGPQTEAIAERHRKPGGWEPGLLVANLLHRQSCGCSRMTALRAGYDPRQISIRSRTATEGVFRASFGSRMLIRGYFSEQNAIRCWRPWCPA